MPLFLLLAIFGRWAISFVYGPEWLPAFPLLLILMVGHVWDNIFFWNRVGLLALNHPIFPTMINFIAMLVKIPLIFLLVNQFQAYTFAALLAGYYIFTSGISAARVLMDVRQRPATEGVP